MCMHVQTPLVARTLKGLKTVNELLLEKYKQRQTPKIMLNMYTVCRGLAVQNETI